MNSGLKNADQIKIVTVAQARMGSTRLPGKVLLDLCGRPVLLQMVERLRQAKLLGTLVVATTHLPQDDAIVELCQAHGIDFFRGDPLDCLDRHVQTARAFGANAVAKIPTDCPLIDGRVIDQVFSKFLGGAEKGAPCFDYVSNLHPPTHPDGNDVEVMTLEALEVAHRESTEIEDREHTTPFLWKHPERFRCANVAWAGMDRDAGTDSSMSTRVLDLSQSHRLTLDYAEDLELIRQIWAALHASDPAFSVEKIVAFLDAHPEIHELNRTRWGQFWYNSPQKSLKKEPTKNESSL